MIFFPLEGSVPKDVRPLRQLALLLLAGSQSLRLQLDVISFNASLSACENASEWEARQGNASLESGQGGENVLQVENQEDLRRTCLFHTAKWRVMDRNNRNMSPASSIILSKWCFLWCFPCVVPMFSDGCQERALALLAERPGRSLRSTSSPGAKGFWRRVDGHEADTGSLTTGWYCIRLYIYILYNICIYVYNTSWYLTTDYIFFFIGS